MSALSDRVCELMKQLQSIDKELEVLERRVRNELRAEDPMMVFARSSIRKAADNLSDIAEGWE